MRNGRSDQRKHKIVQMPQGSLATFEVKAWKYSLVAASGDQISKGGWVRSHRILEAMARIQSFILHKIEVHWRVLKENSIHWFIFLRSCCWPVCGKPSEEGIWWCKQTRNHCRGDHGDLNLCSGGRDRSSEYTLNTF